MLSERLATFSARNGLTFVREARREKTQNGIDIPFHFASISC